MSAVRRENRADTQIRPNLISPAFASAIYLDRHYNHSLQIQPIEALEMGFRFRFSVHPPYILRL
jgi:hypothetical protein